MKLLSFTKETTDFSRVESHQRMRRLKSLLQNSSHFTKETTDFSRVESQFQPNHL
jgi:hypothetical protein